MFSRAHEILTVIGCNGRDCRKFVRLKKGASDFVNDMYDSYYQLMIKKQARIAMVKPGKSRAAPDNQGVERAKCAHIGTFH
ncbi:hypothetical protein TUM12370_25530 [Salmonella enterica subsp. enterica serovar Choleraesuis]|nr:hypothetical protein TUM12370_25530 [Salmonella enterica subsp. enterica serovar Choleraesuis]